MALDFSDKNDNETGFQKLDDPLAYIKILERKKALFESVSVFINGSIVTWKQGMKNRSAPEYGQPGIIMSIVNPAITKADDDPFSTYYTEILDVEVGFLTNDDGFIIFLLDSRRLQYFEYAINDI